LFNKKLQQIKQLQRKLLLEVMKEKEKKVKKVKVKENLRLKMNQLKKRK
jgi:hypothetical protein